MSWEHVALLLGLFGVPALLLAIGHRLRRRPPLWRRVFWGGLIGHSLALLALMIVMMYPPVLWEGGVRARDIGVHWSLILGAVVGGGIAALLPAWRR
ncbi:MAG TPA: hypothetical protein VFR31_14415 [Thermoanaerobaculia bacterium]|nr:hypothetical protein [Thermoanaerobaculia bacterium]